MMSSGLFFQTWQNTSTASEDIIQLIPHDELLRLYVKSVEFLFKWLKSLFLKAKKRSELFCLHIYNWIFIIIYEVTL